MIKIINKIILSFLLLVFAFRVPVFCANIDPDAARHQYAWGENIGWVNFNPSTGPGVTVSDTQLTGEAWAENVGWIRMKHLFGGVTNDGLGNLSGYAWGENIGWISFSCENTSSCDSVTYGASIDPDTGLFSGKVWGENTGWISFDYIGSERYGVKTSWGSAQTCEGDFNPADGDVDGSDLEKLVHNLSLTPLEVFADNFGRIDCFDF